MPLGGFGAGCIGRSPKGDFNLWHLDGGEHSFNSLAACQFSIFEQTEDGSAQAYAMATESPKDGTLSRWSCIQPKRETIRPFIPAVGTSTKMFFRLN